PWPAQRRSGVRSIREDAKTGESRGAGRRWRDADGAWPRPGCSARTSRRRAPKPGLPRWSVGAIIRQSELGDGHFGGFDEGDHFAADLQLQLTHRARGDHRGDDAGSGLHVDFRQDVADDDFLDRALELVAYIDGFDGHGVSPDGRL